MPRKILVPVDLSQKDAASAALAEARRADSDAAIVLLYILPRIPVYLATNIPKDVLEGHAKEADTDLRKFAEENGVGDAEIVLRTGAPGREILNYAADTGFDLIVIASHDPGWEDFLLGSVAAKVVRHAPCSVHVIR